MSVEIDGVNKIIKTDTISEATSANGVAIDSVTLKDGGVTYGGGGSTSSLFAQAWVLTSEVSNTSSASAAISANMSIYNADGYNSLGSVNMTFSSGVFTFPLTGIYKIQGHLSLEEGCPIERSFKRTFYNYLSKLWNT